MGVTHVKSSAYHPQSRGALKRFHATLKTMLRTYCMGNQEDWDKGVSFVLFAMREATQESTGFSPFELIFGHRVRGPLQLLKEKWMVDQPRHGNMHEYVATMRQKLEAAQELARKHLRNNQMNMKEKYDIKAVDRQFKEGDEVLLMLPSNGRPFEAKYQEPFKLLKKLNSLNYLIHMPSRRKSRMKCHVNMLKMFCKREEEQAIMLVSEQEKEKVKRYREDNHWIEKDQPLKLENSRILENLEEKLAHLTDEVKQKLGTSINKYRDIFSDTPQQTDAAVHDIILTSEQPIRQHPYRLNPRSLEVMRKEIKYMIEHGIIEPSQSEWASPCLLVDKPDGTVRFCTDYRKVNSITRADAYPIPRMEDCIDRIGQAKYITELDMLKGYWAVPLTDRAKTISAFVTPDIELCPLV